MQVGRHTSQLRWHSSISKRNGYTTENTHLNIGLGAIIIFNDGHRDR